MPAVKTCRKRKRALIEKFSPTRKSRKCQDENVESRKESNKVSFRGRKKTSQMLEYRRRRLRALRRKRWETVPKFSEQNQDDDGPELRSASSETMAGLDENYIVNLKLLCEGLRKCNQCGEGPLSLDEISKPPVRVGLGVVLHLKCRNCRKDSVIKPNHSHRTGRRGPEAVTLNTRAALAMIHTGQGHSHLNGDLSVLGVGSLSSRTYKKREREVGLAVESVCKKSCTRSQEAEKVECGIVDNEGDALISVSYDGAWQKRGKARDSITGFGTIIAESSGKVLDYGVKSTRCRKCDSGIDEAENMSHDCRKNHCGSSKSMEPEIVVACFNDAPNHGLKYSKYTGDEDATTESHLKYRLTYDTAKKTDRNHATRTLGSRLYSSQKTVKSLTSVVIN